MKTYGHFIDGKVLAPSGAESIDVFDPSTAEPWLSRMSMSDLMKQRADVAAKLETAEAAWLEISEELETVEA